jgi:uncharacterized Zn finger protein/superfamily II DNA or RNA helicase
VGQNRGEATQVFPFCQIFAFALTPSQDFFVACGLKHPQQRHSITEHFLFTMAKRIQYGNTPWGAAWIQALETGGTQRGMVDSRLARGKTYANTGKVREIEIIGSTVRGKVQGSEPRPYKVKVELRPFTPQQKNTLLSFITANPMLAQDLSRGTLPEWFMAWMRENRLPIVPAAWSELKGDCSCPDWGDPCKHQVAVFYALANDLDRSPLLLFHLRGITTKELLEAAGNSEQPDLVPPIPVPEFVPFAGSSARPTLPENWSKSWFDVLAKNDATRLMAILPPKPRFSTAQKDFRVFLTHLYESLSGRISASRTNGKKPSAMPHIWLEYDREHQYWRSYLTVPDEHFEFIRLARRNEVKSIKLPTWQKSSIYIVAQDVTFASLETLIEICSSVAGFSTQKFHTESSRFFCAALDVAYMLVSNLSLKPVLMRFGDQKQPEKLAKTGVIARTAQAVKKIFGKNEDVRYYIRYEPFVRRAEDKEALDRLMATLRGLLPPEMCINEEHSAGLSAESFDTLFADILTKVVHQTIRKGRYGAHLSDTLSEMFAEPIPLFSSSVPVTILANEVHEWLSWLDLAGLDITPILRIEEPADDAITDNPHAPFVLHCEVQDRMNPLAQPIPIRQVLNAQGKVLGQDAEKIQTLVLRTLDEATKHFPELSWMLDARNAERGAPAQLPLSELYTFLTETAHRLRELGVSLILPQALVRLVRPRPRAKVKSQGGQTFLSMLDLIKFEYDVAIGDESVSVPEFKRLLKEANGITRFRNSYVMLSPTEAQALLEKLEGGVKLSGQAALRALLAGEEEGFMFDGDAAFKNALQSLTSIEDITLPDSIRATLRPYQKRGFQWMYSTMERGFGVILADDMGLGKTLQALSLLQRLKNDGKLPHHALIICPTTLVTNWLRECNRFTPELTASIYHGADRTFDFEGSDLVITTYGIVRREMKEFAAHPWSIAIVDEAQNMKNHDTAQTKAVKSIPVPMRLALSGTPVENRLSELWSLFDWLNKGYLHGITRFRSDFIKPIEKDRDADTIDRLRRVTAPFILRRLKSDKSIIADLPDKIITNEYCTLTKSQAALYESAVQNALRAIEGKDETDTIARSGLIFSMITALKQICNHPAHYAKKGDPHSKDSGKAARLMELLDSIQESDEKALIFTQYKEMGTLLERMIAEELNADALFFHGGVARTKRDKLVETFQNDAATRFMIVSLKAGGTGLNLTAATNVIHYDLWWNPAVENQATDRAYRIGQVHNVQVHRFITQATFEEKIDAMIQAKQELANLTVGTGENWITDMSNKELREIFTLAR